MRARHGFTLLELLMVVIIIAILASIALPQYLRAAERSRAAEALTVLAAIRSAQLRFRALSPTNIYSVDPCLLDTDIPGSGCANAPAASTMWSFAIGGPGATTNAVATRAAGALYAGTISLDLDTGTSCTSNAVWGLTVGAC